MRPEKFTKLNKHPAHQLCRNEIIHIPVTVSEIQELRKKIIKKQKNCP